MTVLKGTIAGSSTLNGKVAAAIGRNGDSAYQIAVNNGFEGTEAEWLESLRGETGSKGDTGAQGEKGDAFTYEDFTEEQLASLKGEKGDTGSKGDTGNSGVYLGSGEMPADCNVQIDPNGDADLVTEVAELVLPHVKKGLDYSTKTLNASDFTNGYIAAGSLDFNYTSTNFAATPNFLECTSDEPFSVTANGDSSLNIYYYGNGEYIGYAGGFRVDVTNVLEVKSFTGDKMKVTHVRFAINYHNNKTAVTAGNLADVVGEFTFTRKYSDPQVRQGELAGFAREEAVTALNTDIDELRVGIDHCEGKNLICTANAVTQNGITLTPNGVGKYTVNGTSTAEKAFNLQIYHSKTNLPENILKGHTYRIGGSFPVGISMAVQSYDDKGVLTSLGAVSRTNTMDITIPEDAVGLYIALSVGVDYTFANVEIETEMISANSAKYAYDLVKKHHPDVTPPPMLTIIDDDGNKRFETLLLPVIQSKKIPIASAVPVALIGSEYELDSKGEIVLDEDGNPKASVCMDWQTVEKCALSGAEIISHTYHNIGAGDVRVATVNADGKTVYGDRLFTDEEIAYDYRLAQAHLRHHGIASEGLVYVGDSSNLEECVKACKQVYSYGFKADSNPSQVFVNEYGKTDRYGILRNGATGYSFASLKAMIDVIAEKGTGWLVWMLHTSTSTYDETQVGYLAQAIDYAIEKGIPIVTTEYGVKTYCD